MIDPDRYDDEPESPWALGLIMLLWVPLVLFAAEEPGRPYHVVALKDLALGKVRQTHVHVEGWVTYVKKEADGDLHIRVCEDPKIPDMQRADCVVCECIPELPCEKPAIGSKVSVEGISRFDKENGHKWWEVHPIEKLEVMP